MEILGYELFIFKIKCIYSITVSNEKKNKDRACNIDTLMVSVR